MMSFNRMWFACVLGSFLAAAAMACLCAYMFEAAPVEGAALQERAPLPGRLNELLDIEVGPAGVGVAVPGVDVTVGRPAPVERCPTCGQTIPAGVALTVDPGGVGVVVDPFCPPGGCPDQPEPGTPDAYPSGYIENPDYDEFADGGSDPGGGAGGGFRGVFKFGGKFRERFQGGEGGPLRRLFGKLCGRGG